jgi:hypothetical protein
MKKFPWIYMLISMTGWLGACSRSDENMNTLPGTYSGTFDRYIQNKGRTVNVTITFTESWFDGNSDTSGFPAICAGTYKTWSDSIGFINSCDFPDSVPGSLILNGNWSLVQKGDSIFMRRVYPDLAYQEDVYRLRRQ